MTAQEEHIYLMPDRGIFMSHYKWQGETIITQGAEGGFAKIRDTTIALVMDSIPQPVLQPLTCRVKDCGWNGEELTAGTTNIQ